MGHRTQWTSLYFIVFLMLKGRDFKVKYSNNDLMDRTLCHEYLVWPMIEWRRSRIFAFQLKLVIDVTISCSQLNVSITKAIIGIKKISRGYHWTAKDNFKFAVLISCWWSWCQFKGFINLFLWAIINLFLLHLWVSLRIKFNQMWKHNSPNRGATITVHFGRP